MTRLLLQQKLTSLLCTLALTLLAFTGMQAQAPSPMPTVTPNTSVTLRTVVTITGSGLDLYTVRFNNSSDIQKLPGSSATQILVAVPAFTVTAPATTTNITLNLRRNNVNHAVATLAYHAPNATVVNNAKVSRLYTDWQGHWTSNNTTTVLANQPDRQHSLTAIEYGGITYSTGVADAVLTSKGINYTAADFKALPVNSISGNTPASAGVSNFFAFASKMDGKPTSADPNAPEIIGRKAKDVLIDGMKGLGIGTGMTNMSTSSIFEFVVSDIAESRINDGEPDLVVSQVAEPTTGDNDIYCFVDINGNVVGRPVSVTMQNIPAIGTYKLDLFNITFNSTYDVATVSTANTSNTTRPIRLVGYKLSDFGITADNMNDIAGFKIMPSGISDPAFIAYNANSMLIPSPKIITHPTSVVACTGSGSNATFSVTATGINLTYQWKKNGVSLVNGGNVSGATSATLNLTNIATTDVAFYTCEVTNAAGSVLSNAGYLNTIIAVQPLDNTACYNVSGPYVEVIANGLNLTYQWYVNTTNSNTGGTIIPGATNYYYVPPVNVPGSKYYYVVIDNNGQGCVRETSTAARFAVGTQTSAAASGNAYIGGTAENNNNITTAALCSGNTTTVRVAGSAGTSPTYQWEQSIDGISGWNNVTGGTGSTSVNYTTPALTETTYYRMRVKTSSCEVYTNVLKLTVGAEAGVIEAASKNICTGTSTTVSVTGATTAIQWQQSNNGTSGWVNVSGGSGATSEVYTTPVLTASRYYRTIVTGEACSNPNSEVIHVIVNPTPATGTISGSKSVCTGSPTFVRITGATGNLQWQNSTDNITFTDIPGATNDIYTTPALTQTTYYRVTVMAVGCTSSVTSAVTTITVSTPAAVGTVTSSHTICSGFTTTLNVSSLTGTARWQQSADGISDWSNAVGGSGSTSQNYTTPVLTATAYYRFRATNGACVAYSPVITVTVTPITAGTAGSNQTVCQNGAATVSISGQTAGTTIQWEQSTDGSTGWVSVSGGSGATTASYTTPALTSAMYYRAAVTNQYCTVYSAAITVNISSPAAGTASGSANICPATSANLSVTGNDGTIQWQQSANGSTGWVNVIGGTGATTANYTTAALSATTYYKAIITSGSCTSETNVVTVTINNTFIWNGSVSNDWHVPANWSCNAIPTLLDNAIIPQQTNQPVVSQNIMAYAKTLDIQAGAILTINTQRNITVQDGIAVASTGNMIVNNRANLVQLTASSSNNTGNIDVKRNSSALFRMDYTLWSTPVTGQNLFQFSPQTLSDRFYTYNDAQRLYVKVAGLSPVSTTTFNTGVAYLIRMPNGNSAPGYNGGSTAITLNQTFRGVPNNGTITMPVVHQWTPQSPVNISYYGYNGLGNPYPSTINIHSFIDTNEDNLETGTLYFWRKKNNNNNTSYTAINKFGYTENGDEGGNVGAGFIEGDEANWVINPGQGFIVQVKQSAATVEFNNTMRRAVNNNQFFRSGTQPEFSRIWLNMTDEDGAYTQALVGYSDATTNGLDFGYDTPVFTDGLTSLYTKGANKDLSIQARGAFANTDVVPLSYKVEEEGLYTINLHKKDGVFANGQTVYLKDSETNTIHNLTAGAYTFTANGGVTDGRFNIVYVTDGALGTDKQQALDKQVVAYKNNGVLHVTADGHELNDVKVFDTRGRLLFVKKGISGSSTSLDGLVAQEQMLILQISTKDGITVSRKVVF